MGLHVKHRARALGTAVLTAVVLFSSAGCEPAAPVVDPVDPAPRAAPDAAQSALSVLGTLPVKGRAAKTGYDRDRFGAGWVDTDHNGCDTRNDVLARDLTGEAFKPGTRDCVVVSGTLADPYTGTTIEFVKGDASSVDIDHVVALSNGWQTGASGWDDGRRTAFANDPLNLLAVDYAANRQKGDGDAATWLPPARGARCGYVARQVAVKVAYELWVTSAERDAMARVLDTCPAEPVPDVPAGTSGATEQQPYPNCAAARDAGAAPLHRGDPGWSDALDGDGDGDACE